MSKAISVSAAMEKFEQEARVLFHALNYSRQHQAMSVREFCGCPAFTDALAAWTAANDAITAAIQERAEVEQQRGMERAGVPVPVDEPRKHGYDAPTMAGNEASPDDYPERSPGGFAFRRGDDGDRLTDRQDVEF